MDLDNRLGDGVREGMGIAWLLLSTYPACGLVRTLEALNVPKGGQPQEELRAFPSPKVSLSNIFRNGRTSNQYSRGI